MEFFSGEVLGAGMHPGSMRFSGIRPWRILWAGQPQRELCFLSHLLLPWRLLWRIACYSPAIMPFHLQAKSPDRQFVPVYDLPYYNWPHERRLSVSGTDDGAAEGTERPADAGKNEPIKPGQGLPLEGKHGDKDQPSSAPEADSTPTSPTDVTDPAQQPGQTETATTPPSDADKTAVQKGTPQAKQKRKKRRADLSNGE